MWYSLRWFILDWCIHKSFSYLKSSKILFAIELWRVAKKYVLLSTLIMAVSLLLSKKIGKTIDWIIGPWDNDPFLYTTASLWYLYLIHHTLSLSLSLFIFLLFHRPIFLAHLTLIWTPLRELKTQAWGTRGLLQWTSGK